MSGALIPGMTLSSLTTLENASKLCVAVSASSVEGMLDSARRVLAKEPFLEVRLDALTQPQLALPSLHALIVEHPEARIIATCRRTVAGGGFAGSVEEELGVLGAAAAAGCSIVDLALETAEAMHLEQHRLFREVLRAAGTSLLISYHDYRGTRDLKLNLARLLRHQPDLVKIVSTATTLADNLSILQLPQLQSSVPVVALGMGEPGIVSRILGPRAGSAFTFAASGSGAETAPGQFEASTLRDLYRIGQITAATRVYGVAGTPIAHSLSPLLHNTGFRAKGVDAVYLPLATGSAEDLLRLARELPLAGFSVTMPLKQALLPLLDRVEPLAARVGACNTVVRTSSGAFHGYNTDVAGVTVPLEERIALKGARILVQGAGGAARAAVFGLRDKGAEVWILNRTVATAAALAVESGARVAEPSMLRPGSFDVLVNATPAGMHVPAQGEGDQSVRAASAGVSRSVPADEERAQEALPAEIIFDMVYRPLETPLIVRARAEGRAVITGVEMFVHQGARQFELWAGEAAPEDEMLRVVLEALHARP